MVAIFAKSGGGVTIAFPDVCKVPPRESQLPVPTPYPTVNSVLINVAPGGKAQAYKVRAGRGEPIADRTIAGARSFVVGDDGSVTGHRLVCTSPAMARTLLAPHTAPPSATVISTLDDGRVEAYRVTERSQRRLTVDVNPPGLLDAIRALPA